MDECAWRRCATPARLDVLLGQSLATAECVGSFCVPHASLISIDSRHQAGTHSWYDWHRPSLRDGLADELPMELPAS